MLSCPDAIGRVLEKVMRQMPDVVEVAPEEGNPVNVRKSVYCPDCGSLLEHEGGCVALPRLRIFQMRLKTGFTAEKPVDN